jgi:2-polyprenyl-3-methyl-5-hydroxy-6-metoxy-1,4-benzoquinol methylase
MVTPDRLDQPETFYPLRAYVSERSWLVQVPEFCRPSEIFDDSYTYYSSFSTTWVDHARRYCEDIIPRLGLDESSRVVEIASNDGYLLQWFVQRGIPCLGIEPTANTAAAAADKGVTSWVKFFGKKTAEDLVADGWQADLLLGNNVFAHVPDLDDFCAGLRIALKPGGTLTLEFPHLLELILHNQFDTIYHEHYSYFSLHTASLILARHGLKVFDVLRLPTHGGSLRIYACRADDPSRKVSAGVDHLLREESAAGLQTPLPYVAFQSRIETIRHEFLSYLLDCRKSGRSVAGYGAAAKGNTLLNFCGVRSDLLPYVADASPHKQGKHLPGSRIPVVPPEKLIADRPEDVVVFPWNLRSEIEVQLSRAGLKGCRLLTFIPHRTESTLT